MFRAFLHYSQEECEEMDIQKYLDSTIILDDVLKIMHAPFLNHDE